MVSICTRDLFHLEFTLSFETIHQTQPGWALLFHQGYEDARLNIAFDYFEVIKWCHDPRDVTVGSILSAELLSDGTGMVVKEPLISQFFIKNIDELSTKGSDKKWGATRRRDYGRKMKLFHSLASKNRLTTLHFPRNIIGTNEFIGSKRKSA